jgi:mRNA interferase RelE/StbE
MGYSIEFRPSARKTLVELPASERCRISKAIQRISENPYGHGCKKLRNTDYWRIRAGDYRVVYSIVESKLIVVVIRIGHRREVYRGLE